MTPLQVAVVILAGLSAVCLVALFITDKVKYLYFGLSMAIVAGGVCTYKMATPEETPLKEIRVHLVKTAPVFILTNDEVIYGDQNSYRDSTGMWHLKDRKLPDRVIKKIHF